MRGFLYLICFVFMFCNAFAQQRPAYFTYTDLQKLISDHQVTTVDELLPLLPQNLRRNPVMVYETRALRGARVSFQTPRVILFNNDASLILAFTKNPGTEEIALGEDELEVIFFDHQTAEFSLEKIILNGKNVPYKEKGFAERNPQQCLLCHGQNPRPLFPDYNAWPGFYGSFGQNGFAVRNSNEYHELKDFLATYKEKDRYKHLQIKNRENRSGIYLPSSGLGPVYTEREFSQNLAFGAFVEFLLEKKIAMQVSRHEKFETFKPILQYITSDCEVSYRYRVKKVFDLWTQTSKQKSLKSQDVLENIELQLLKDFKSRERELLRNNYIDLGVDSRGLINLPYEQIYVGSPPWARLDKEFFQKQLVLMELFYRFFDLTNSDISTVHERPTSGIFHIRKFTVLKDEPYFMLLKEGFDSLHRSLLPARCDLQQVEKVLDSIPAFDDELNEPVLYRGKLRGRGNRLMLPDHESTITDRGSSVRLPKRACCH